MFNISFVLNLTSALKEALRKLEKECRTVERQKGYIAQLEEELRLKDSEARAWRKPPYGSGGGRTCGADAKRHAPAKTTSYKFLWNWQGLQNRKWNIKFFITFIDTAFSLARSFKSLGS